MRAWNSILNECFVLLSPIIIWWRAIMADRNESKNIVYNWTSKTHICVLRKNENFNLNPRALICVPHLRQKRDNNYTFMFDWWLHDMERWSRFCKICSGNRFRIYAASIEAWGIDVRTLFPVRTPKYAQCVACSVMRPVQLMFIVCAAYV